MTAENKTFEIKSASAAVAYLDDQYWHDSVLYEIVLIRTDSADRVILKLDLLSDWEEQISTRVELAFNGCMHVKTQMNWGIECMSGGEMIHDVECSDSDPVIESTRKHLGTKEVNFGVFRMEMASTSSIIEVVFSGIEVSQIGDAGPHNAPPPLFPGGSN